MGHPAHSASANNLLHDRNGIRELEGPPIYHHAWAHDRWLEYPFISPEIRTLSPDLPDVIETRREVASRLHDRFCEQVWNSVKKSKGINEYRHKTIIRDSLADADLFASGHSSAGSHDWQGKILYNASQPGRRRRMAVRAPNGAGKDDRIIAPLALWWLRRYKRGRVITTAD